MKTTDRYFGVVPVMQFVVAVQLVEVEQREIADRRQLMLGFVYFLGRRGRTHIRR